MKLVVKVFTVLVLVALILSLTSLWIYRDIPAAELEAQYAAPSSRFVEVEGVRYHVRQEGQGPDVVLLHGSFGNLAMWDEWVNELKGEYRITRMDLVAHGLTGRGQKEYYSTDDLTVLLHGLLQKLELNNFHLVGTSIGGIFGFTYAAEYPGDVRSLTLINSAGLIHKSVNPNPVGKTVPWRFRLFARITPRYLIDDFVSSIIGVEQKATPEVLQTYYDMIMRDGNRQALLNGMKNYQARDPSPWLKKIVAPTLIVWSDKAMLPEYEAREFIKLLEQSQTQIVMVEGNSHVLPISHPLVTANATADFWRQVENP